MHSAERKDTEPEIPEHKQTTGPHSTRHIHTQLSSSKAGTRAVWGNSLKLPKASKPSSRSGGSTSFPKGSCARDAPVTATSSRDLSAVHLDLLCVASQAIAEEARLPWGLGTAPKHLSGLPVTEHAG